MSPAEKAFMEMAGLGPEDILDANLDVYIE